MDLPALKLFLHLSYSLHFHKTSQACFISPSGLTRSIQRLEEEIGQPLFKRDNRSVSLTTAGRQLQTYATRLLDTWEAFLQGLEGETKQLQGNLDLYCSVTASYSLLQPLISRFRQTHPRVHLRIQTGEAAAALDKVLSGEADLGITARPETLPEPLRFKELRQIPLILIAPRTTCQLQERLLKGAAWHTLPLILPRHGLARKWLNARFREEKITAEIYADIAGNEAIIAMVALGCGIGLVPELVLEESAQRGEVRRLEADPGLPPYRVGFCIRESKLKNRVVRAFWEAMDITDRPLL